jgi:hypothetical protein
LAKLSTGRRENTSSILGISGANARKIKQNQNNPQLHPQLGENLNERVKLMVEGYFGLAMTL